MNCLKKQQGLSFLGFVFLILVLIVFGALLLRLYPLYYEKFQIISAMKTVTERADAADLTPTQVRTYFMRNIEITNIRRFTDHNLKQYLKVLKGKKGQPNQMKLTYTSENKFFQDIYFTIKFDETMPLGTARGE